MAKRSVAVGNGIDPSNHSVTHEEAASTIRSLLFVLALSVPVAWSQSQPPPPALSADLPRYYFKTPAAELAARADLDKALAQLGEFKGEINSAKQLLSALQTYDGIQILSAKHEGYLHLVCSRNRKDPACEADEKLESDVDAKTAFLAPEILAIPEDVCTHS